MRHGSADALARLARGEDVDASEYPPRTAAAAQIGQMVAQSDGRSVNRHTNWRSK